MLRRVLQEDFCLDPASIFADGAAASASTDLGVNFVVAQLPVTHVELPPGRCATSAGATATATVTLEICQELGAGLGGVLWDAGRALGLYLVSRSCALLDGRRVLELGSGSGFVGLCAHLAGAARVVLSDLPALTGLLARNVARNAGRLRAGRRRGPCPGCGYGGDRGAAGSPCSAAAGGGGVDHGAADDDGECEDGDAASCHDGGGSGATTGHAAADSGGSSSAGPAEICVVSLDWLQVEPCLAGLPPPADVVLCSDTLYEPALFPHFLATLERSMSTARDAQYGPACCGAAPPAVAFLAYKKRHAAREHELFEALQTRFVVRVAPQSVLPASLQGRGLHLCALTPLAC